MFIEHYLKQFHDHDAFVEFQQDQARCDAFFERLGENWQARIEADASVENLLDELDEYGLDWSLVETEEDQEVYSMRLLASALFGASFFVGEELVLEHFKAMPSETALAAFAAWGCNWCPATAVGAVQRRALPALAVYFTHRHIQHHLVGLNDMDIEREGYSYFTPMHCREAVRQDLNQLGLDEHVTRQLLQLSALECERGDLTPVSWPEPSMVNH